MTAQPTIIAGLPRSDSLFTRVILDRNDLEQLTSVRTTDSRTALARGLAEYLGSLTFLAEGGRECRFERVQVQWAEPEVAASFPSLAITALGPAQYDDSSFEPSLVKTTDSDYYITQTAETTQEFMVAAWSTDPMHRVAIACMLEDASDPVEFMTGFRLELPFYHGARATYLVRNVAFQDGAQDAQRRWRVAMFGVTGNVPKYRLAGTKPGLLPQFAVDVY